MTVGPEEIRLLTEINLERCKNNGDTDRRLHALLAMIAWGIAENAAQLAELNKNFHTGDKPYGAN